MIDIAQGSFIAHVLFKCLLCSDDFFFSLLSQGYDVPQLGPKYVPFICCFLVVFPTF
jgi:hypothetical protein